MSKIGKLITVAGVASAVGAGVYYYLNKKDKETADGVEVEGDAISQTASDVVDFFKEKKEAVINSREYIQLNKSAQTAKDTLMKTVKEAADVILEKKAEAEDGVGVVAEEEKDKAEEFEFEEFEEAKEKVAEVAAKVKEDVCAAVEEVKEATTEAAE